MAGERTAADVMSEVLGIFGPEPGDDLILIAEIHAAYAAIRALVSGGDREPHRAAIERAMEAGRG